MKKLSSIRRCEVVTRFQDDDGNIFLNEEDIPKIIDEHKCIRDWAYIIHDKDLKEDDTPVAPHVHIIMRFEHNQPQHIDNVGKWFNLQPSCVEKIKGSWEDACKYLVHKNASDKFQYSIDDVSANFDIKSCIEKENKDNELQEIVNRILSGEIREYNKTLLINQSFLVFNARVIREAFKVRSEHLKATVKDRNTNVIYITGTAGSGKTTLAKKICNFLQLPYFITSGSNDLLDSYAQEPCIIADDIRPSVLGISDLLKFLDSNTASSVKSRYFNKFVNAELIILTSVLDITEFYHNVFENEKEPITQLQRRCNIYISMDRNVIRVSLWDKKRNCYSAPVQYVNDIVSDYIPSNNISKIDVQEQVNSFIPFLTEISDKKMLEKDETIEDIAEMFNLKPISDEKFYKLLKNEK